MELKITPYIHDGKTCFRCGNKKGSKETCIAWGTIYNRHQYKEYKINKV